MATVCPDDYISIERVTDSCCYVPCQLLIRYVDFEWKRQGYPHLTGDLRVNLNKSVCEATCIHVDDAPRFFERLKPYIQMNTGNLQNTLSFATTLARSRGCGCSRR